MGRPSSLQEAALALGVRGYRVTSLSDAVFSIIATITTVPLAASVSYDRKTEDSRSSVVDALSESKYAILYCVLTFNIVSRMQHYHAVIFDRVKRASVLVVLANTVYLLLVSFIPMGQTLLSEASVKGDGGPDYIEPVVFFVGLLSLVRFSGAVLVYLLPMGGDSFRTCLRRRRLVQEGAGGLIYGCLAVLPKWMFTKDSQNWGIPCYLALLLAGYKGSKLASIITLRRYWRYPDDMVAKTIHHTAKRYSRSRVDAYTDGVLAISATLIILDISSCETGSVNSPGINECGDVLNYLNDRKSQLYAYMVTFVLICALLWARHASMWKYVTQSGMILHALNTQCLCFIALMSYSIELMMSFDENDEQRRHAVTFWLSNVFVISVCILIMGAGIFSKHNTLPRDEKEALHKRSTRRWTFLSGLLLPFWTLLGIIVTLTVKEGQKAWSLAIGFQIILHPLSQLIVFWRYMLAHERERDTAGDLEEDGLTRSLLGDARRSTGEGGGVGGHSTISRGYYSGEVERGGGGDGGDYEDYEEEERAYREGYDEREIEQDVKARTSTEEDALKGKHSTSSGDTTNSTLEETQADETQIIVDTSLLNNPSAGTATKPYRPPTHEDEKKGAEPPQAAFDLLARQVQGLQPPLKPEAIITPKKEGVSGAGEEARETSFDSDNDEGSIDSNGRRSAALRRKSLRAWQSSLSRPGSLSPKTSEFERPAQASTSGTGSTSGSTNGGGTLTAKERRASLNAVQKWKDRALASKVASRRISNVPAETAAIPPKKKKAGIAQPIKPRGDSVVGSRIESTDSSWLSEYGELPKGGNDNGGKAVKDRRESQL